MSHGNGLQLFFALLIEAVTLNDKFSSVALMSTLSNPLLCPFWQKKVVQKFNGISSECISANSTRRQVINGMEVFYKILIASKNLAKQTLPV